MVEVIIDYTPEALLLGIGMAIFIPFVSMISPVFNEISIQLRDALDVFSHKATAIQI